MTSTRITFPQLRALHLMGAGAPSGPGPPARRVRGRSSAGPRGHRIDKLAVILTREIYARQWRAGDDVENAFSRQQFLTEGRRVSLTSPRRQTLNAKEE
ncbi:hypothetical protein SCOCK_10349 [Actinacidiphila cocklensis]|uniref:Uncharacterized protein n=1 Tax=Actinacidiphila cocklensis TaxID=887465 RepID=A0A9W4GN25_9ACTN|nr:hypothetical protein SCOCK_10349 [Actinacidiphila cocklensis]